MPSSGHRNPLALFRRHEPIILLKLKYFLGLFRNFGSINWRLLPRRLQSLQLGKRMIQLSGDHGFMP
jgi:hypothetical protein